MTLTVDAHLKHVEEEEQHEERVAMNVEGKLPLDALLDKERVTNALAVDKSQPRSVSCSRSEVH
jgi:hypothetical protein